MKTQSIGFGIFDLDVENNKAAALMVETVSPTERAAKVNWLHLNCCAVYDNLNDEHIEQLWQKFSRERAVTCEQVTITLDPEDALRRALNLAVMYLEKHEPGDSRAVSNEFVALAAVSCGNHSAAVMKIIDDAILQEMQRSYKTATAEPIFYKKPAADDALRTKQDQGA